jgi:hypothetical protein
MDAKIAWRVYPGGLKRKFKPSNYFAVEGQIAPLLTATVDHPHVKFVQQLCNGIPLNETDIARLVILEPRSAELHKKSFLRTGEDLLGYRARVVRLLESVRKNGVVPAHRLQNLDRDVDIGIALLEQGVVYYRRGRHRLAAAIALGITQVPCQCYFVSKRAVAKLGRPADWRRSASDYIESLR